MAGNFSGLGLTLLSSSSSSGLLATLSRSWILSGSVKSSSNRRSSIISLGIWSRSIKSSSLSCDLVVLGEQTFSFGAVKVEPPIADEVVLVEDGSIRAEETVLAETTLTVSSADMEHLAFSFRVSIITSINLTITGETRLRDFSVNWVIFSRYTGDRGSQHSQRICSSIRCSSVEISVTSLVSHSIGV